MKCSKCDTDFRITQHHVHPVVHHSRKGNDLKVYLCFSCHSILEIHIKAIEDFVRGYSATHRHKLERRDYEKILRNFLGERKIIYVSS